MSNNQPHTSIPGPSRADIRGLSQLIVHLEAAKISTRVGGGWHDRPRGPPTVSGSPIVQSEQTQRGKLSPEPGRAVE